MRALRDLLLLGVATTVVCPSLVQAQRPAPAEQNTYAPRLLQAPAPPAATRYFPSLYSRYYAPGGIYAVPTQSGFTTPTFTSSTYGRSYGFDSGFRTSYFAPGPANYLPGLNSYYPSPRYWNYYYPGY